MLQVIEFDIWISTTVGFFILFLFFNGNFIKIKASTTTDIHWQASALEHQKAEGQQTPQTNKSTALPQEKKQHKNKALPYLGSFTHPQPKQKPHLSN